jgi:1-acyl-sn-glycerol-3-phosphate acyltransferase
VNVKELGRTLVSGAAAVGITGSLSPIVSVLSLVDERAADGPIYLWSAGILKATGVETRARGVENLPAGNFVLAVNHQSHFDALVLFTHIRRHMRFVAKADLLKVPIFGPALKRAGNVFVDRSGGAKDKAILQEAITAVRERVSIVFFAEGTRSDDGLLRPFKKGAAWLAIEAGVPLVPAALGGTHAILPKKTLAIRARPATLVIGQPIRTQGLTIDDRDKLTQQAHDEVARLLVEADAMVEELKRG